MTHYIQQEVQKVEQGGQKLLTGVEQVGQAIINNPLPVIETLAIVAVLPEALPGLTLAQQAAISAAAVSAANGGNPQQIATAAATAGVGAEVTQLVAPEVGPTPISGAAAGSVNPLAQAAGGAAAGATQAALTGQDIGKAALTGGAVSGLASTGAQEVSSALSSPYGTPGQSNIKTELTPEGLLTAPSSSQIGLNIPTGGGLGIVGDPNVVLPSSLAQYATAPSSMRAGPDGTLIPAQQYGPDLLTPGGMEQYNLPQETNTPAPQVTPGLSPSTQSALQTVFGYGLDLALAPKPTRGGGGVGGAPAAATGTTTGTTSATTGGAPGGTELDPSTGKAPQQVWGDKYASLKEGLGA
jgi:hypothetical protein